MRKLVICVTDTKERLQNVFWDVFDDNSIVLIDELSANDIDEWDSLTHIQLIVATEQEFGITFMTAEVAILKNVGEFIDLIEKKLQK